MGSIYRETYTKPLPTKAELFMRGKDRYARWIDRKGHSRTAKVTKGRDGSDRVVLKCNRTVANFRNGAGLRVKVSTGCRTSGASRAVLVDLETRAEKVRSGKWTVAEDAVLDHQSTPIDVHVTAYVEWQKSRRGKGAKRHMSPTHIQNIETRLAEIVAGCQFTLLRDLNRAAVEIWMDKQSDAKGSRAASTINAHAKVLCAFGNWCVSTGRLISNPCARPPKLNEQGNQRHNRRALTEGELHTLLRVTALRPLAEYGRETVSVDAGDKPADKRSRRTWKKKLLTLSTLDAAVGRAREVLKDQPQLIADLEHDGRERALIYKMLLLTGLRSGELASLTVGQLDFNGPVVYAAVKAVDEKAGRGADIPLRGDLAADLWRWLMDRLHSVRAEASARGEAIPARLPSATPLFKVPPALSKILNRDLAVAGIAKRDERNLVVDVHAMRHTFCTMLSRGGVAPRTAQAAMRHSSINLTMNTYTDPKLLNVAEAMNALPSFPLGENPRAQQQKATGTSGRTLVAMLGTNSGNASTDGATTGKTGGRMEMMESAKYPEKSSLNQSLTTSDVMTGEGFEPSTHGLKGRCSTN